jgi:hypothetical protein
MAERPISPSTEDVIRAWIERYLADHHTAMPGRVHAVNMDNGTVDVEPLVRHPVLRPDGGYDYEDLPILPAVPVVMPRLGDWFLSMPISRGDFVLVVLCESAHGHWWAGDGELQYPGDLRRHDLSHGVAIPGFVPRRFNIPNDQGPAGTLAADLVLGKRDGTRIAIKGNGDVAMVQGGSKVFEIVGGVVKLSASATLDVARKTDPVLPSADLIAWMNLVQTATGAAVPASIATSIGTVNGGNPNVKA